MADNLKIVEVSYNGKPITKNEFLGKILKTDDDVIPMASSLFKNEGKDKKSVKGAVFGADWIFGGK